MYKQVMKCVALLFTIVMVATTVFAQDADTTMRTFQPLDRGWGYQFDYPLGTHSVRTYNLSVPVTIEDVFGALIAVEPNDAYVYTDGAEPTYTTVMRVLAINTGESDVTLMDQLGNLPLIQYDATTEGIEISETTLGGQPAVRADHIPTVPGDGATEIIGFNDGMLYQIVIEPVVLGLGFDLDSPITIDPVYETILASWQFTTLEG